MRKIMLLCAFILILSGCNHQTVETDTEITSVPTVNEVTVTISPTAEPMEIQKTEYTMSELLPKLNGAYAEYEEKTAYWTEEEIEEKREKLIKETMEEYDIPVGREITLRGIVDDVMVSNDENSILWISATSMSENENDTNVLWCYIKSYPQCLFADKGSVVVLKGTINISCSFIVSEVISLKYTVPEYSENLMDVYEDKAETYKNIGVFNGYGTELFGYIAEIYETKDLDYVTGCVDFDNIYSDYKYIVLVGNEDNSCLLWLANDIGKMKKGSKIYLNGDLKLLQSEKGNSFYIKQEPLFTSYYIY